MRADALKNRTRILEAAEEIFATEGISVPIDDVAKRAGVGVGTLYRHFPTKEALFEAIVIARIERLLETAKGLEFADDPKEALFTFLREFATQAAAKRDLIDALQLTGVDFKSQCSGVIIEMMERIDTLLQRAVKANAVRADVPVKEVVDLVASACHAGGRTGTDQIAIRRMVEIVIDGLRLRNDANS